MRPRRQGDIFLSRVKKLPKDVTQCKNNTLAYGETTGHHHTVYAMSPETKVQVWNNIRGQVFVEVEDGEAALIHSATRNKKVDVNELIRSVNSSIDSGQDFHRPNILDPGIYEVDIEEEEDPFTEELIRVVD